MSYATILPLALRSTIDDVQVNGSPAVGAGEDTRIHYLQVDADYFSALRIPLLAGRELRAADDERALRVAVVNETMAKRFWPDGSAIGRTFRFRDELVTIVGIARDARYASLTEVTPPLAYVPLAQRWDTRQTLIVRSDSDPRALGPAITRMVASIDEGLPRPTVVTLERAMGIGVMPQRVAALVTGVLGVVGLVLAMVGLYGVIAWSASRRTREIGIRLALGAHRRDVLRMIANDGLRLTAVGLALGLALSWAATRLLSGFLFGLSALDGVTYIGMSAIFIAVAIVASWLPARRAAGVSPMVVLRGE